MHTWRTLGIQLMAAGMMLFGHALAQQTPAAGTSPSTSSQTSSPAASSQHTTAGTAAKKAAPAPPVVLNTDRDKESYAMGMNFGAGLHRSGLTLDPALVARGLKDAQSGAKTALTDDEARAALAKLRTEVNQKVEAEAKEEGAKNRQEGEAFLAANKSKPGVVTLPSGLQYKVLTEGTGPKPTANDTVSCNYRGTLINGTEFDSSYKRGRPETFPVNGVIKGWTEALQLMPVGSKWQLFIPSDLAYGDRPPGRDIAPGDTLIFEVELLSIADQKK